MRIELETGQQLEVPDGSSPAQIDEVVNHFQSNVPQLPTAQTYPKNEDFLQSLDPRIATQVKAIAEGKMAVPSGFAMKTPYWQQMMQAVSQYDPQFDAVNYNARNKTYQDFTSGKSRQNINSIDTAMNTLAQLQEASANLGGASNWGVLNKPVNWIENAYKDWKGDPNLVKYDALAKTAADEVTKAVVGGTGGTGGDREKREAVLSHNNPPETRTAAAQALIQELSARLDPLAQAYNQGMGTNAGGVDLLTPKTAKAYQKIMGVAPDTVNANGVKNLQSDAQNPANIAGNAILQAKSAIAKGAPKDAVIQRLKDNGIDPTGL